MRRQLIEKEEKGLSIRRQCELLSVSRSGLYYQSKTESTENLELMNTIDRIVVAEPSFGILRIQDALEERGFTQPINIKRIRRLTRKMGIEAIYPKRNLSKLGKAKYVHPYLLRDYRPKAAMEVWAIDITYVPMKNGFLYLTAIIDVYSRFIVGWDLSNSLEAHTQTDLLEKTIAKWGKPKIINSDQGSQYTSANWVDTLRSMEIKISMDGKGRATDNAHIERFFRSIKWDYIYLYAIENGTELYKGIDLFIRKYNRRRHQGINRLKPIDLFKKAA